MTSGPWLFLYADFVSFSYMFINSGCFLIEVLALTRQDSVVYERRPWNFFLLMLSLSLFLSVLIKLFWSGLLILCLTEVKRMDTFVSYII